MTEYVELWDSETQTLRASVRGPRFAKLAPAPTDPAFMKLLPDDLEQLLAQAPSLPQPDVVTLFSQGARGGLFGRAGMGLPLVACATDYDPVREAREWTMQVTDLPRGALRVLRNLLAAMGTDELRIETIGRPAGAPRIRRVSDLDHAPPPAMPPVPITLPSAAELTVFSTFELSVEFAARPSSSLVVQAERAVDLWSHITLCQGYNDPEDLAQGPSVAFGGGSWDDAWTFRYAPESFSAHPAGLFGLVRGVLEAVGPVLSKVSLTVD